MAPPIIEYVNVIKKYKTPGSKQVQDFLKKNSKNLPLAQVEVINKLVGLSQLLK